MFTIDLRSSVRPSHSRRLCRAAVIATVISTLFACGGGGDSAGTEPPPPPPPPPPAPTPGTLSIYQHPSRSTRWPAQQSKSALALHAAAALRVQLP